MHSVYNTFCQFKDDSGKLHLVSIESILNSGYPIDADSGNDMELIMPALLDNKGDPI